MIGLIVSSKNANNFSLIISRIGKKILTYCFAKSNHIFIEFSITNRKTKIGYNNIHLIGLYEELFHMILQRFQFLTCNIDKKSLYMRLKVCINFNVR